MAVDKKPLQSVLKRVVNVVQPKRDISSTSRKRLMVQWPSTKEKMEKIRRRSSLNENQIKSLWLDYQEFCSLRDEIKQSTEENKDKGYSKLLQLPDNEKLAQLKLDLWAKAENDLNMRGLERYVNSDHRQWRDSASREVREAVLEAQKIAQETDEFEDFAEYLAAISSERSADSRHFAGMIAKADEKAVAKSRDSLRLDSYR